MQRFSRDVHAYSTVPPRQFSSLHCRLTTQQRSPVSTRHTQVDTPCIRPQAGICSLHARGTAVPYVEPHVLPPSSLDLSTSSKSPCKSSKLDCRAGGQRVAVWRRAAADEAQVLQRGPNPAGDL